MEESECGGHAKPWCTSFLPHRLEAHQIHYDSSRLTRPFHSKSIHFFTMSGRLPLVLFLATFVVGPALRNGASVGAFVPQTTLQVWSSTSDVASSPSTRRRMFTGIVEEMGTVVSLEEREDMVLWDGSKGKGTELVVKGDVVMEGAYLG